VNTRFDKANTTPKKEINVSQQEQSKGLYRPIIKDGTHLASSQDTPGTYRGTLYDDHTNKLVAHAEWERVDEDEEEKESSSENLDLRVVVGVGVGFVVVAMGAVVIKKHVAPRVKILLQNNKVAPPIKKRWQILTAKIKDKQKSNLHTNEIVPHKPSYELLEEAYQKYANDMTSEEAQRELLDIFILSALLIAKITKLSNSRIIDGDAPTEYLAGQKVLEWLNTPEYISCINQILQNNPQLLEEKAVDFHEILGRNLVLNGSYIPIEIGNFKEEIPQTVGDLVNGEDIG
jgi:hypothetical protein